MTQPSRLGLKISRDYFLETFTISRLRPFARRRFKTFFPAVDSIRFRKPCFRFALILLGWKVLFIIYLPPNLSDPKIFSRLRGFEKPSLARFVNAKRLDFSCSKVFFKIVLQIFFGLLHIRAVVDWPFKIFSPRGLNSSPSLG